MLHIEKWKAIAIILISLIGVAYAVPNILPVAQQEKLMNIGSGWLPAKTVNLGLDLRGGSHILLEVDTQVVIEDRIQSMLDTAKADMRKQEIGYTDGKTLKDGISIRLRDVAKDKDAAYQIVRKLQDKTNVDIADDGLITVTLTEAGLEDVQKKVVEQSIEIVRRRVDESGTKEPVIQRQGTNRIVLQLPGIDDPEHVKDLLGKTAKLTFHLLDENARTGEPSPGSLKLPMKDDPRQFLYLKKRAVLNGDNLIDSQPGFDENGSVVTMQFDAVGSKKFCDVSRDNIGKVFAIVLDNVIISAPYFLYAICGGHGQISGNFTTKEANDLSMLLRAGALPAPLKVVEERSVGPTLGSDSIVAGKHAAMVAFVLVFSLMALTYGLFGMFANIALALNLIFIFAALSVLQATLTLPGIAGIILTIGIAVDANVLIYERIREEIRQGRSVMSSIDTGYRLAWNTIVDSNLTTLIVALILFSFGSGPIKGFAVAMCIGIITSMFSAIMITRLMVVSWLKKYKPSTLNL